MTLEEANQILDPKDQGYDGYAQKLIKNRQDNKIYLVSTSSDDGGVGVSTFDDILENWNKIELLYNKLTKISGEYDTKQEILVDAIEQHSICIVSTSFWG